MSMTASWRERDLEEALRAELAAIEPQRSCCRAAARAGLGAAARGRARNAAVARLAVRLEGDPARGGPPTGDGTASDDGADGGLGWPVEGWDALRDHCRVAWLRSRFLATASVSVSGRATHVEFVLPEPEADVLAARLSASGFPAASRVRRGRAVVTWKSTEIVLGFLRACGASAAVLELESRLVTRQLRSHLNRVLNAETANLKRSVATAARQLAAIDTLESRGDLATMPDVERAVALERRASPEASFSELALRLGYSRARVQRALERLEATARRPA
jgi:hypothetical protein